MLFNVGDILVGNDLSDSNYGIYCKRYDVKAVVTNVKSRDYKLKVIQSTQVHDMGHEMYLPASSVEENMELARELTSDELFEAYIKGSITEQEYLKRKERA